MEGSPHRNEFGQPVGGDLGQWVRPPRPSASGLSGDRISLEPLERSRHAQPLFDAFTHAPDSLWTYMPFGPFEHVIELGIIIDTIGGYNDWESYAIVVDDEPLGFLSYLRIDQRDGVIEIGAIAFAPVLQRTAAATEALYLMIDHVFELGYRRCEWKCDDLNEPSRLAAARLGFVYEGTFRQATHYKGRNRDTAWYSITNREWPALGEALAGWLAPDNFDPDGQQRRRLRAFRRLG